MRAPGSVDHVRVSAVAVSQSVGDFAEPSGVEPYEQDCGWSRAGVANRNCKDHNRGIRNSGDDYVRETRRAAHRFSVVGPVTERGFRSIRVVGGSVGVDDPHAEKAIPFGHGIQDAQLRLAIRARHTRVLCQLATDEKVLLQFRSHEYGGLLCLIGDRSFHLLTQSGARLKVGRNPDSSSYRDDQ